MLPFNAHSWQHAREGQPRVEVFRHIHRNCFKAQAERESVFVVFVTEDLTHCHGAGNR